MGHKHLRSLFAVLILTVAVGAFTVFVQPTVMWLMPDAGDETVEFLDQFVYGGFWLCIAWLCCILIDISVWHALVERRTGRPVPRLVRALVRVLVFLLCIALIVLYVFGKPITAIAVSSGAVGIVIGFALQRTINDFFSGIALNAEGPFKVGHWIEMDDVAGKVIETTWRATHLVTLDGISLILPNSALAERRFLNYNTPSPPFRVNMPIALEYAVPVPDAKRTLLAALRATRGVLSDPAPDVLVTAFGNDGVEYLVRFYVHGYPDMHLVKDAVGTSISRHIWQAGMSVPYPKRDVYYTRMPTRHVDRRTNQETLLARIDLFESLEAGEIQSLGSALREHRVSVGTDVVQQGDDGDSLFLVVDGLLEVRRKADDGRTRTVARLEPGQCFGEMSLLSGEPRSATVTAITDGTLFELDRQGLAPILQNRPEIADLLSGILLERQEQNRDKGPDASLAEAGPGPTRTAELVRRIRIFFGLQHG